MNTAAALHTSNHFPLSQVTQQLFGPLVFQMIHWFTRNTQYESPDTIALLDAILVIHACD